MYLLICRLGFLYHCRVSFVRDVLFHFQVSSFPCSLSSMFYLSGTCWILLQINHLSVDVGCLFYISIGFYTHHIFGMTFFILGSPHFYSVVNKPSLVTCWLSILELYRFLYSS